MSTVPPYVWPRVEEFIDRTIEIDRLETWWAGDERMPVNLYGRRRVGKSWLFRRFAHGKPAVLLVAERLAAGAQLTRFVPLAHGHDASRIAAAVRDRMLADQRSFITETVFSHPSKVALVEQAAAAGYLVHLHVLLVPVELSVARVAQRVTEGGHDVPVDKIRQRHQRLWTHVAAAIEHSYETRLWDSTGPRFVQIARFLYGQPVAVGDLPAWTPKPLIDATASSN